MIKTNIEIQEIFSPIIKAFKELYPDNYNVKVEFDEQIKRRKFLFFKFGCWGYTEFPESSETPVIIRLSVWLPIIHTCEILAHELAHVVAGLEASHGEKWEQEFSKIHQKVWDNYNYK